MSCERTGFIQNNKPLWGRSNIPRETSPCRAWCAAWSVPNRPEHWRQETHEPLGHTYAWPNANPEPTHTHKNHAYKIHPYSQLQMKINNHLVLLMRIFMKIPTGQALVHTSAVKPKLQTSRWWVNLLVRRNTKLRSFDISNIPERDNQWSTISTCVFLTCFRPMPFSCM